MPYARLTDPITSVEAADSVKYLSETKKAIIDLLKMSSTDEELVNRYQTLARLGRIPNASPSGIRSRRHELAIAGLVKAVGYTKSMTGRRAIVWIKA